MTAPLSMSQLYKRYGGVVYGRCRQLLRDATWAQDATQDVFVKLMKGGWPEEPTAVGAWIHRVTTNHCFNLLRTRRRAQENTLVDTGDESDPGFETSVEARDLTRRLLDDADEEVATTVELFHVRGLEQREIARTMGVSRRTVIYRLSRFQARAHALAEV